MARKNLLGSVMGPAGTETGLETKATPPMPPRKTSGPGAGAGAAKGAVGAVSQTIADLKARAVVELDPHLIKAGGLDDRLEHDPADHARLVASLRDYGQQVPVLVRPHPEEEGHYQIVYGRRRVLALRDLGLPVKAMIRTLDDAALILAQGQENTARRDLSFIEKANFARQMREAGYKRKVICDALDVDKTQISRMLSIADRIDPEVLAEIGSAPGVGRDRWAAFADLAGADGLSGAEARALARGETSDARFESLMTALTLPARAAKGAGNPAPARKPLRLTGAGGADLGQARWGKDKLTLVLAASDEDGFADWLLENVEDLHRRWQGSRDV